MNEPRIRLTSRRERSLRRVLAASLAALMLVGLTPLKAAATPPRTRLRSAGCPKRTAVTNSASP